VSASNKLYFGDNLDVMRAMPAESIDLIARKPRYRREAEP
jgi:DNA modification methylase